MKPTWIARARFSPYRRRALGLSPGLIDWLLDGRSLTARLRQRCCSQASGGFEVEVIKQTRERPRLDEARVLGLDQSQRSLVREVLLLCDGQPWVFARTVLPLSAFKGRARRLASMGNRPLGAWLFAQPCLRRRVVQLGRLPAGQEPITTADKGPSWGRRSVFEVYGQRLLVSEFFLHSGGFDAPATAPSIANLSAAD